MRLAEGGKKSINLVAKENDSTSVFLIRRNQAVRREVIWMPDSSDFCSSLD
jgi:hypothetical protein